MVYCCLKSCYFSIYWFKLVHHCSWVIRNLFQIWDLEMLDKEETTLFSHIICTENYIVMYINTTYRNHWFVWYIFQGHKMDNLSRIPSASCTKVFVQRDYLDGTGVKFQNKFPLELEGKVNIQESLLPLLHQFPAKMISVVE